LPSTNLETALGRAFAHGLSTTIASAIIQRLRWGALNPPPAPLPPLTDPAVQYSYEALEVQIMRYNSAYGSSAATRFIMEQGKAGVIVHTMSDTACRRLHAAFVAHWPKTLEQLRANAARAMLRKTYKEIADAKTQNEGGAQ